MLRIETLPYSSFRQEYFAPIIPVMRFSKLGTCPKCKGKTEPTIDGVQIVHTCINCGWQRCVNG
jgi:hypothetical protein